MTKSFPYLALDSAGERTVLCDRPQDGCFVGGISQKVRGYARDDTSKVKRMTRKMLSNDQLLHYVGMSIKNPVAANRYWARCMGRDAAMDDETAARIKEFLSDKLSDKDHTKLCNMLDGESEAQDEPPPDDVPQLPGTPRPGGSMDGLSARQRMQATDSMIAKREKDRDDFFARFPDAAKINIDNSGIPHRQRAASYSADGAASFAAMFPDAARIKVA